MEVLSELIGILQNQNKLVEGLIGTKSGVDPLIKQNISKTSTLGEESTETAYLNSKEKTKLKQIASIFTKELILSAFG